MGVQFDHPWILLLLPLVIAGAVYAYRKDFRLAGARKKWAVGLRTSICVLLILVLAGFHTYTLALNKEVVFVADRSASISSTIPLDEWIGEAVKSKGDHDLAGAVSFGMNTVVDKTLSEADELPGWGQREVSRDFTHIEHALSLAGSLFQGKENRRLVLITDGMENVGAVLDEAQLLKERGIAVDVLPVTSPEQKDASIEELLVPEKLYPAESFAFEVLVRSTYAGSGELRLYEDNREIGRHAVTLERGDNRYSLQGLAKEAGLHRYRAEIYIAGDEQSANNANYAFTRVTGSPKVLIVEGASGTSANLENALSAGLIDYSVISPGMLSSELPEYAAYDSIIFNNVSGEQVGGRQMELIEQAVRSYGVGFMMVGGQDSFGMGGYFKTPIEQLLPVSMELEGKREIPSLGLILVIDRSGSMDGEKLRLAKESAIRTVELLREKDTVGVLAFDDRPWWVVEPQRLDDKESVISTIHGIPSGGGTDIYPAVADATAKMLELDAQRKHIILLTDGQSAGSSGYAKLIESMVDGNITMSTVAVGGDADVQLLQSLASGAKGRYYLVEDETTLPAIFSREAAMIARTYIVDKPFVPAQVQGGDWSSWFKGGLPQIYGYVAATAKSTAQTVLASPEPDPLLARWQYGSGRTVAWTSDMTGKWSRDWVAWPSFPGLFTDMVKWTFPQFSSSAFEVETEQSGNEVRFTVRAANEPYPAELTGKVTGNNGEEAEVVLSQVSPGNYEGAMAVTEPGSFLLQVSGPEEGAEAGSMSTGFVVPYSPEYRLSADFDPVERMEALTELTGGRWLAWDAPEAAYDFTPVSQRKLDNWDRLLLILALLLWVCDIAVRRLAVSWSRLLERLRLLAGRSRRPAADGGAVPAAPQDPGGLGRLAARKSRTAAFYGGSDAGADRVRGVSAEGGGAPAEAPPARPPRSGADAARSAAAAGARTEPSSPPVEETTKKGADSVSAPGQERLGRLLEAKRRGGRRG